MLCYLGKTNAMKKKFALFLILIFVHIQKSSAQQRIGFTMPAGTDKVTIPFEELNNLIVIPVILNNLLKLKFILDTGVETPILTEEAFARILNIDLIREITISGPGLVDSIHAKIGQKVKFQLPGGIIGHNLNLLVLEEDYLKLSQKMGDEIYGILGYDLFRQFVIDINYDEKIIILHRPEKYKAKKKQRVVPLKIISNKPYFQSVVRQKSISDTVKLMIDTGASHALILDVEQCAIPFPTKSLPTKLGTGLGGDIPGTYARISEFKLVDLLFKEVIISIPDTTAYNQLIKRGSRQGTMGGEMLSRMHPVFDYNSSQMYIAKSNRYGSDFEIDMSGLSIVTKGRFLDTLMVEHVRKYSPAYNAGVLEGDIILMTNGYNLANSSLSRINATLKRRPKYKINIRLLRGNKKIRKKFRLQRAI